LALPCLAYVAGLSSSHLSTLAVDAAAVALAPV
jgi:hypothetical protein